MLTVRKNGSVLIIVIRVRVVSRLGFAKIQALKHAARVRNCPTLGTSVIIIN